MLDVDLLHTFVIDVFARKFTSKILPHAPENLGIKFVECGHIRKKSIELVTDPELFGGICFLEIIHSFHSQNADGHRDVHLPVDKRSLET